MEKLKRYTAYRRAEGTTVSSNILHEEEYSGDIYISDDPLPVC